MTVTTTLTERLVDLGDLPPLIETTTSPDARHGGPRPIAQIAVEEALRRLGGVTLTVPPEAPAASGTPWSSVPRELPVRFEGRRPARWRRPRSAEDEGEHGQRDRRARPRPRDRHLSAGTSPEDVEL